MKIVVVFSPYIRLTALSDCIHLYRLPGILPFNAPLQRKSNQHYSDERDRRAFFAGEVPLGVGRIRAGAGLIEGDGLEAVAEKALVTIGLWCRSCRY